MYEITTKLQFKESLLNSYTYTTLHAHNVSRLRALLSHAPDVGELVKPVLVVRCRSEERLNGTEVGGDVLVVNKNIIQLVFLLKYPLSCTCVCVCE